MWQALAVQQGAKYAEQGAEYVAQNKRQIGVFLLVLVGVYLFYDWSKDRGGKVRLPSLSNHVEQYTITPQQATTIAQQLGEYWNGKYWVSTTKGEFQSGARLFDGLNTNDIVLVHDAYLKLSTRQYNSIRAMLSDLYLINTSSIRTRKDLMDLFDRAGI